MSWGGKPDGGPAFPIYNGPDRFNGGGMTLRDWFAGHNAPIMFAGLVQANLAAGMHLDAARKHAKEDACRDAWVLADAMIAEREKVATDE